MDAPQVPRLWPGETVVCLASGPSLTPDDVAYCRGKAHAIAINTTYQLAPWADVLYAADYRWWTWYPDARTFAGLKYSLDRPGGDVVTLTCTGDEGLEERPHGLRSGRNSGYQAINLAVHFGAARIVLLGYDMAGSHWHASHPGAPSPDFRQWIPFFATLCAPLRRLGVAVVNCTRDTALTCFPRQALEATL